MTGKQTGRRGHSSLRRLRRYGASLAISIVGLALAVTPASAVLTVHPGSSGGFGVDGQPLGRPFLAGLSQDGSSTPQGSFDQPCGTAVDSAGDVYVSTHGTGKVSIFAPDGSYLTQFSPAANGAPPCGLAVDSTGVVYVNGSETDVYRYAPSAYPPTVTTTYGGGVAVDTGNGATAVTVDPENDKVYVDDLDHVVEYSSAANGNTVLNATIGAGTLAASYGLVISRSSTLYANDDATHRVYGFQAFGSHSLIQTLTGADVPGFGGGFGSFTGQGLAYDPRLGQLLVANAHGSTQVVDEFRGSEGERFVSETAHSFEGPVGIAVDRSAGPNAGNAYVTSGTGAGGELFAFGPHNAFRFTGNLAIDQGAHRLYVLSAASTQAEPNVIRAFDISVPGTYSPIGFPFPLAGLGIRLAGESGQDIAVDNSGPSSATDGNLYAASPSYNREEAGRKNLYGWRPDGTPLEAASGWPAFPLPFFVPNSSEGGLGNTLTTTGGLGVDPGGDIWVGNSEHCGQFRGRFGEVDEYSPETGARVRVVDARKQGDIVHNETGCAGHVDFAANGDMYVTFFTSFGGAGVWRYPGASEYQTATRVDPQTALDVTVDRSTGVAYTVHGQKAAIHGVDAYDPGGSLYERFATGLDEPTGVAVDEATGTVFVAAGVGIYVFPGVRAPEAHAPTGIDQSGAVLHASLDPEPDTFSGCQLEYVAASVFEQSGYSDLVGPGGALAGTVPCSPGPPYSSSGDVSAALTGLDYETTYHYRFVVTSSIGTIDGTDGTFATDPAVYDVLTGDATDLSPTAATLTGSFSGDGHPASFHFEWGQDSSYGNVTPTTPAQGETGTVAVVAGLVGLAPHLPLSEPYHYRLVVTNDVGTTYGPDRTFLPLPPPPPQVSETGGAANDPHSATLSATINPNLGPTVYAFEYGTDTSYGSFTPTSAPIGADQTDHGVSAELHGLAPATVYHFRAVATNFGGTTYGSDRTLVTPDLPRIESAGAASITAAGAHLEARVVANASPTTVRFEYGTGRAYGLGTAAVPIGSGLLARDAGAELSGLEPGTTYHFRVVAVNAVGAVNGPDGTFTTTAPPGGKAGPEHPKGCRRGFVRRHGKCWKRPRHPKHHRGSGGGRS